MSEMLPDNALRGDGIQLSPWTAVPDASYCAMRYIEGTDPHEIKNRVAFIEKTPRVRVGAYEQDASDYRNWFGGYKGTDGWDAVSQGWADQHLLSLGYQVPDPKPFDESML